ncbi:MAG: hypothetical protein IPI85_14805 [Dehalococcoidia bacterium]|nr:hypothetical protein [Dehalococcoidia bacterium]
MRFPPGVGDGPKGDPNSAEKLKARRMRAERQFKELTAAGEPIPEEMAKTLYDLGSDLAPGGPIWVALAGAAGGGGGGGAPLTGLMPDGSMRFPPGVGDGPKGDPNSAEKVKGQAPRVTRTPTRRSALAACAPKRRLPKPPRKARPSRTISSRPSRN